MFTINEIATHFDISSRTVHRYIVDMSDMGIYFESTKGKNGGMKLISQPLLPPVLFNHDEVISLFFAMHTMSYIENFPFSINIEQVKKKLLSISNEQIVSQVNHLEDIFEIRLPKQNIQAIFINQLIEACLNKTSVEGLYHSTKKASFKQLNPIGIYFQNGFWYLYAVDRQIDNLRHYRIDRFETLTTCETTFKSPLTLQTVSAPLNPEKPIRAEIAFTRIGVLRCSENILLAPFLKIKQDNSGYLALEVAEKDIPYTFSYLMSLGKHATIISPLWLKERFACELKEIQKNYE